MRYLFGLLCIGALSAFPLIGCSSDGGSGGTGGTGATGGSAGEGGEGGVGGSPTELRLFVQSWEPGGATGALPGVEICQMDANNCVTTGEDGNATIELPADEEVALELTKEGFGSYLDSHVVPAMGAAEAKVMATDARFNEMHELVGSPYPMEGTGTLHLNILNGFGGATLALVGDATGPGWYRDENLDWDAELTATTSGGGGGFTEVSPGVVQVDIGGADCTLVQGWAGDADNRIKVPIKEGFLSRADVNCEAP